MSSTSHDRIVTGFVERLDEVADRCTKAIWDTVSTYAKSGDELRDDVGTAVRDNVGTLAQVLKEQREIRKEELEAIERTGARRAEAGIPLDDVLHAYRTVSRVCWDILADECRSYEGDALDAAIELAEAVLRYTDQISTSVAEAYAQAQRAIVRHQEGERREFLADLLYGSDAPPEDLLSRAHTFGYDLTLSYIALVGVGPKTDQGREVAVIQAAAATGPLSTDPIVLERAGQTVALLPSDRFADVAIVPEKMVAELGGEWCFGVGGPELGLEGIRRAYIEAKEALEIGLGLGLEGRIFRFDDLLLYHFLRTNPELVDRYVGQMLGPLIEYDERRKGELIKTLESYFRADGSVKMAGELLFAHPHTVTYRIKQIEKLTGWSLRDAEDKLRLQLALRAYRLSQARRTEAAD
ncbi:MAG TPA: helix-turn-helix domain-containing protein [Actinomycetota bacterium]|nr:helix-turn-helix domain-containing protein [Actinomycetota bacterium]